MAARRETPHDHRLVWADGTEVVMRKFLAKHGAAITGTLSCFDRLLNA